MTSKRAPLSCGPVKHLDVDWHDGHLFLIPAAGLPAAATAGAPDPAAPTPPPNGSPTAVAAPEP